MRWLETVNGMRAINPAHLTHIEVVKKLFDHDGNEYNPQRWQVVAFAAKANQREDFFVLDTHDTQQDAQQSMDCFLDQIGVIE